MPHPKKWSGYTGSTRKKRWHECCSVTFVVRKWEDVMLSHFVQPKAMNDLQAVKRSSPWRPDKNGNGFHARMPTPRSSEPSRARPPRILVLWASVGSGHKRAAEAIELAVRQRAPQASVRSLDVLSLATRPFRRCYGQMYIDFIDR